MARPKSNRPAKMRITLSVSKEGRAMMDYVAAHNCVTVSEIVEDLIKKEAQKIEKKTKKPIPLPQADQLTMWGATND